MSDKRTYADRREYLIASVQKHRLRLRQKAAAYKGGACENCGYNKCFAALEFHHRNPSEKSFTISKRYSYSWQRIKKELDKCIMLCANCHREFHARENGR